jgi:Ca2+/H+ antiporter, TMEM165/GDT1 family
MTWWTTNLPAIAVAFSASFVEVVEALTIVLAVMSVRGPRPAMMGTIAGLGCLALIVLIFGPVLDRVPLQGLQLAVGVLLLLFGMRWLRKAILRAGGIIPLHDEMSAYTAETAYLQEQTRRHERHLDWLGAVTSFKAVLIEGLEVVFIVIAVGAGRGLLLPASLGALAACAVVLLIGVAVRRPLARVPKNTLKFGVGVMLSAFGVFWAGEGMGIDWPGSDLAIVGFALSFLAASLLTVAVLKRRPVFKAAE